MKRFTWYQFWRQAYHRIRGEQVVSRERFLNMRRTMRRSFRKTKRSHASILRVMEIGWRKRGVIELATAKQAIAAERAQLRELIGLLVQVKLEWDGGDRSGRSLRCATIFDAAEMLTEYMPQGDNRLMAHLAAEIAWRVERELRPMNLWAIPTRPEDTGRHRQPSPNCPHGTQEANEPPPVPS